MNYVDYILTNICIECNMCCNIVVLHIGGLSFSLKHWLETTSAKGSLCPCSTGEEDAVCATHIHVLCWCWRQTACCRVLFTHLLGATSTKLQKFIPRIFGQICSRIKNPVILVITCAAVSQL